VNIEDARKEKVISDQAVQIAEFAAKALVAAEQLRIKMKPLEGFWLAPGQRDLLLLVPGLSKTIKNKLAKDKSSFTVVEVASMTMALAVDLPDGDARKTKSWVIQRPSKQEPPEAMKPHRLLAFHSHICHCQCVRAGLHQ
jgi:hypothetical protein